MLVLLQEVNQGLDAFLGHGVVDGGAQAADGLVALEVVKAGCLGGGDDFGVELLGRVTKGTFIRLRSSFRRRP
jgi:hypothetical protein